MKTSDSVIEITKAIGAFQKECPTIKKNAKGYGYNYATFDSIVDIVKPLLLKHGIVMMQSVGMCKHGNTMTTRLQHVSGEYISDTMVIPKMDVELSKSGKPLMNNVQALGATITYLKRYQLSAIIGISVDEDTDGVIQQQQQYNNNQQRR